MLFGLFNNPIPSAEAPSIDRSPARNKALESAVRNFLKLGNRGNLLLHKEKMRSGSLSRLGHASEGEVNVALDNLERLGLFKKEDRSKIIQQITDLLASKELKILYADKTANEIDKSLFIFRELGQKLAKAQTTRQAPVNTSTKAGSGYGQAA